MLRSFIFIVIFTCILSLFSINAMATDLYINASTGDDNANDCTSEESPCKTISHAHSVAASSGDTINLAPGIYSETYDSDYGIYVRDKSFSLVGANAATTIIDSDETRATMRILDNTVGDGISIEKVTIQDGHPSSINGGCLIVQLTGDLTLTDVVMNNCVVDNNYQAGGLYHYTFGDGSLIINRSYFTNCQGKVGAAIVSDESGEWTGNNQISNSTFYSNTVTNNVGATVSVENPTTFTNNTFYSNSVGSAYGSISSFLADGETSTLINNLFYNPGSELAECAPLPDTDDLTSGGGNMTIESENGHCNLTSAAGDTFNVTLTPDTDIASSVSTTDSGVGYLAIPGTSSDLYNSGTNTNCASTDVREVTRPQFTTCDVGAFEFSATANVDPSSASLSTTAGSSTISSVITFTNESSVTIDVNSIDITGDSVFTVTSDNCTGESIAGSGTCTFKIQYAPTEEGSNSGTATVDSEASNSPTVALTGTASAAPVPALSKAPSTIAFDNTTVGSTSDCETVTITSSGTGDLIITTVGLSDEDNFSIASNTCTNATLEVDETCTMSACFNPASAGDKTATISITSNAATSPDSIPLSGTGVPASGEGTFTFSSDTLDLSILITGLEQKCSTLTATNIGDTAISVSDVSISDDTLSLFSISEDGCNGKTIAPDGTCSILVCFSQIDYDEHTATLTVTSNAASNPDIIALSGKAYRVRVNSVDVDMEVEVGATTSQSVTVTIEGDSSATFGEASISSVESSLSKITKAISANGFTITEDTCSNQTIEPSGTCGIAISFEGGTSAGTKSATLNILSDVNDLSVSLSGNVSESSGGCSLIQNSQDTHKWNILYLLLLAIIIIWHKRRLMKQ